MLANTHYTCSTLVAIHHGIVNDVSSINACIADMKRSLSLMAVDNTKFLPQVPAETASFPSTNVTLTEPNAVLEPVTNCRKFLRSKIDNCYNNNNTIKNTFC